MFQEKFKKRIFIILIIFIILFISIFIKIFYIQVINYNKIKDDSFNLWSRKLPITPDRGLIKDRSGNIIVDNKSTLSLYVIPKQIEDKELVSNSLSKILNVDKDVILKHLNKNVSIEKIHPEGRKLDIETSSKIKNLNFKGVLLLRESDRLYPYNSLLSHVIGFTGIDNQGLSGIELKYNNILTGTDGYILNLVDGKGQNLNKPLYYTEPTNGFNINLTIDLKLQEKIENELDLIMTKYNPEQAHILAVNPNTGEILGMSSRPNFEPANYNNFSEETINRNLPLFNTYEPGSTFKIITLAASLEEKTIDLYNDHYYDTGHINVEGANIKCWKKGGHGYETFLEVVENSCNPGFVIMGQKLGKERLMKYIKEFGFGEITGIDMNGEENGILFDVNKMGPVETATTSFGQGISVTAIQQVMAVSAAINGGYLLKPFIVSSIENPNTHEIILKNNKTVKRKVISDETSKEVRNTLESVVAHGTGRNAYIDGYRVGGKTGTAQKVKDGSYLSGNYILSFIGFMPADNPEILIYVAIDNPKGVTQYGGTVSAPIAKNILLSAIDIFNIKKRESDIKRIYEVYEIQNYEVPDLIGKSLKEAKNMVYPNLQIEYVGTGEKIINQSPSPHEFIKQNSKIKIFLE